MARQPRLQYEGAVYHVINRGNYRSDVFTTDGAKEALLTALLETTERLGWVVHSWVIMSNHFHVALETPRGNLVEGMQFWQGVFATRFNRLRDERGHIFQGRYKSLVIEDSERLGALCHYIHLNPVRAGICSTEDLPAWPWTSLKWLQQSKDRPACFDASTALQHAGSLPDTKSGHHGYFDYLTWLAQDEHAQRELKFEQMSKGWLIGSDSFKKALIEEQQELKDQQIMANHALAQGQSLIWQQQADKLLRKLRRTEADLLAAPKSAAWKVAIAAEMKSRTTVTNRWLGEHLNMGTLHEVSRLVTRWRRAPDEKLSRKLRGPQRLKA